MSLALKSAYQLVDGLLDLGLPFVASYIEQIIHYKITITDGQGLTHYPNQAYEGVYFDIVSSYNACQDYLYDTSCKCLFYPVDYSGNTAWVIVPGIKQKMVPHALSILREARLAIKCYFSNLTGLVVDRSLK